MVYKSGQIFLPFCHNSRVWQTDGQTEFSLLYMQRGKNYKFKKRKKRNIDPLSTENN